MDEKPEGKKQRKPRGTALKRRIPAKGNGSDLKSQLPDRSEVNINVSREEHLAETILDARGYTEEELDTILLGLENQEGSYDWVDNMNEFRLPEPLKRLEESGEQAFHWVDTSDEVCMIQISREHFRWVPVNMLSHGKYFPKKEQKLRFNRHGGIMSGYMLLCWMPGKLHRAWQSQKHKMSRHGTPMEKPSTTPGVKNYDPVVEGSATTAVDDGAGNPLYATPERFSGVVYDAEEGHPDQSYEEQGEYTD